MDPTKEAQLQLLPQERVQNVKPCWETIPDEQRVELLSVDLNELKVKADDLAEKAKKQAGTGMSLQLCHPAHIRVNLPAASMYHGVVYDLCPRHTLLFDYLLEGCPGAVIFCRAA